MIVSVMFIGNEISNDMVVECSQGPTHVFWEQVELDRDKLLDKTWYQHKTLELAGNYNIKVNKISSCTICSYNSTHSNFVEQSVVFLSFLGGEYPTYHRID